MAKLVDAPDLGSGVAIRVGSSPIRRTNMGYERVAYDVCCAFFFCWQHGDDIYVVKHKKFFAVRA